MGAIGGSRVASDRANTEKKEWGGVQLCRGKWLMKRCYGDNGSRDVHQECGASVEQGQWLVKLEQ